MYFIDLHPLLPLFLNSLFETLITVDQSYFSNFVLLGDFNINYFCITHPLYHHLCNLENSFSLTQVVDSPTRFSSSLSSDLSSLD